MSNTRFTVTGFPSVIAKLNRIAAEFPRQLERALRQEMEIERKESMKRTPVDTGNLRASHVVIGPEWTANQISISITVGGPSAPYAAAVHENLEAYHAVGQAKFLESTLRESAQYMAGRISRRIDLRQLV